MAKKREFKLVIGICTGGTVRAETMMSLIGAIYYLGDNGIAANILTQIGGYVAVNRNKIVADAIAQKATHLLFLDADMMFGREAIYKLIEHDLDVVAGNYNVRKDPTSQNPGGTTIKMMVDGQIVSTTEIPDSLFKCYAAPTGFMLIKLDIFKKLKKPYFVEWETEDGIHTTEDIEFCKRANDAGIDIYCDPSFKIGHIGSTAY